MGCSFLSKPVTEKLSTDESNDRLCYGASSMQGWRVSQEDDHNCLLDFDTNTSFFAVYDGHGGHEVAQYCSQNLPQYIKNTSAYKEGDLERALIEGFLGFDNTITTPEVLEILTKMAGENVNDDGSDDEENIDNLYEEAAMPIEQVIEKYTNLVNPALKGLKKGEFPKSPFLKAKKDVSDVASCSTSSSSKPENTEVIEPQETSIGSSNLKTDETNTSLDVKEKSVESPESNGAVPQIKVSSADSPDIKEADTIAETPKNEDKSNSPQNGGVSNDNSKTDTTSPTSQENGDVGKGKGKATPKNKTPKTPVPARPKRNANQLYKALLNFGQDSEDEDTEDDDKTFEGPDDSSDDEDEGVNVAIEMEGSEEESSTDEVGDDDLDEEDEDDEDDEIDLNRTGEDIEKPGYDSGCTAVVAVLKGNELYVANAGDSRCIVCRNGKAIEMSLDHKPEDDIECKRIEKAGGKVNWEGRVNGGLNLSRALGDHSYKRNKELSDREQMITALPDIKTLTVNPKEDEFMVLACDGIWNFMSSQEVVDFVRPIIDTCGDKLSTICEEMFDHCLAPNTFGDGTGCDNMTAIIVRFKSNILKRSASEEPTDTDSKRAKTEEKPHIESTV